MWVCVSENYNGNGNGKVNKNVNVDVNVNVNVNVNSIKISMSSIESYVVGKIWCFKNKSTSTSVLVKLDF